MINPPNNNKFIGLQDQQTLGQLNDPLQTEQDFLAKRMSQPVPVPGDQSPMMQTNYPNAGVKRRATQPLPKPDMPDNRLKHTTQKIEQVIQQNAPLKQTNYPHAGTKYNYKKGELLDADDFSEISGQSDLAAEKYSDIQQDEKGQYVTSLGQDEYFKKSYDKNFKRPTSSKHIDKWSENDVLRDTIRASSGKAFISWWKEK